MGRNADARTGPAEAAADPLEAPDALLDRASEAGWAMVRLPDGQRVGGDAGAWHAFATRADLVDRVVALAALDDVLEARAGGAVGGAGRGAVLERVIGKAELLHWPRLAEPLHVGPGAASWDAWTDGAAALELGEAEAQLDGLIGQAAR